MSQYLRHFGFKHDAEVSWEGVRDGAPAILRGHAIAAGLDGVTIRGTDGRIHHVKPELLTEVEPNPVHSMMVDLHSELTVTLGRKPEDRELHAEHGRRIAPKSAPAPKPSPSLVPAVPAATTSAMEKRNSDVPGGKPNLYQFTYPLGSTREL